MGFLDFLKKKNTVAEQKPQSEKLETNSFGERLDRLTPDGELPFGWHSKHAATHKQYEDRITQAAVNLRQKKGAERIAALEQLVALYSEYKEFCYSEGECHVKYFSDMWEHCHNSRCDDFEYIAPYLEELESLKKR